MWTNKRPRVSWEDKANAQFKRELLLKQKKEDKKITWEERTPSDEDYQWDIIDEPITIFGYDVWHMLIAVIVWIVVFLLVIANTIETSQQRIDRIKAEISDAQEENIALANVELEILAESKAILMRNLWRIINDELIYTNCIELNTVGNIPVDCSWITLSLKQKLNWKVNSNWKSQDFIELDTSNIWDRMEELLNDFPQTKWTYETWIQLGIKYDINPAIAIAIAKADTSLGNQLKTANNIGNVGNNDRWDTVSYDTLAEGIEKIYQTLNNKYLKDIYTIGYLSEWGRITIGAPSCKMSGEFCYATSEENWNNNVINTLRLLYNDASIDESFKFRS